MSFSKTIKHFEQFFGNLKFAVVIILIFAATLGFGTFMESYHGTEFANKLVYKSLPFMFIQFLMFMSILTAALMRLPPKKHLYGFYTIHAGLITIFCGSVVTYIAGVDGTLSLPPNSPNKTVTLNEDQFTIRLEKRQKEISYALPPGAFAKTLNDEWENIKIVRYLPFSDNQLTWTDKANTLSGTYMIRNDRFGEEFTLSLDQESDFPSSTQMGLLNLHYMPKTLFPCFAMKSASKFIIWNTEKEECFTPESRKIPIKTTKPGNRFLAFRNLEGEILTFFPDFSPLPVNEKLEVNQTSPYRIFSQKIFEEKPHLFLFGDGAAFFDKNTGIWESRILDKAIPIELPWMGFKLTLKEYFENKIPKLIPHYARPLQDNGKIVMGEQKSILINVLGQDYWVTSNKPLGLMVNNEKMMFEVGKKTLTLPYQLTLSNFKMDTDPGTENPASYESFVNLFDGKKTTTHHIFMNNPLKHDGFTFYQASYFKMDNGTYGSVLSVNFDPGRPIKYFGSILLIFGTIWHYAFIRRKKKVL